MQRRVQDYSVLGQSIGLIRARGNIGCTFCRENDWQHLQRHLKSSCDSVPRQLEEQSLFQGWVTRPAKPPHHFAKWTKRQSATKDRWCHPGSCTETTKTNLYLNSVQISGATRFMLMPLRKAPDVQAPRSVYRGIVIVRLPGSFRQSTSHALIRTTLRL